MGFAKKMLKDKMARARAGAPRALLKIVNTHLDGIFSACLCPKILKYTKYSMPAEGGMPAIVLAGKLTTPQALSAILELRQSKNLLADLFIANSENRSKEPLYMRSTAFLAGGAGASIDYWIRSGYKESPEQAAQTILNLVGRIAGM